VQDDAEGLAGFALVVDEYSHAALERELGQLMAVTSKPSGTRKDQPVESLARAPPCKESGASIAT
jgi:hypothetical protein